jgi:hypothetical protein
MRSRLLKRASVAAAIDAESDILPRPSPWDLAAAAAAAGARVVEGRGDRRIRPPPGLGLDSGGVAYPVVGGSLVPAWTIFTCREIWCCSSGRASWSGQGGGAAWKSWKVGPRGQRQEGLLDGGDGIMLCPTPVDLLPQRGGKHLWQFFRFYLRTVVFLILAFGI